MSDRLLAAAVGAVVALTLGACGGGGSSRSSSASTVSGASSSRTTATTTRQSAGGTSSTRTRPTRMGSAGTPTGSSSSSTTTTPPPTPQGTPSAPPGLRQTTGYSTYEGCAGDCSGAVPAALRRPLHLPHAGSGCPASAAGGPVTPQGGANLVLTPFIGSAWKGARVLWLASAGYTGPVLIRGGALGGSGGPVGFGEGHDPYDELQLLHSGNGAPTPAGGGRAWLSFTRVRAPGCYAYQVDGTSFSDVIVFRAT